VYDTQELSPRPWPVPSLVSSRRRSPRSASAPASGPAAGAGGTSFATLAASWRDSSGGAAGRGASRNGATPTWFGRPDRAAHESGSDVDNPDLSRIADRVCVGRGRRTGDQRRDNRDGNNASPSHGRSPASESMTPSTGADRETG
jgi:hypothetical protein